MFGHENISKSPRDILTILPLILSLASKHVPINYHKIKPITKFHCIWRPFRSRNKGNFIGAFWSFLHLKLGSSSKHDPMILKINIILKNNEIRCLIRFCNI